MKIYVALLRGINISGKNKLSMTELKVKLEETGFNNVVTYHNSGNVIVSVNNENKAEISAKIKSLIKEKFNLDIPVFVTDADRLNDVLSHAPDWWGRDNKEIYSNLIFVIPPATAEEISEKIGAPTEKLEKIKIYNNVIFWSFDRKKYSKSNWWKKTSSAGIGEMLTIRTANTVRKVAEMGNRIKKS